MKVRKFAIAFVVITIAIAGCGTLAPASTQITTPPTQVAESPAPTNTSAPSEPSPTATETTPQLEVVEWYRWSPPPAFEGDTPNTYVEVLVRNPYDYPVNVYEPAVQFLNAGEVVLRTRDIDLYLFSDVGWNMILPGETVPGRICACLSGIVPEIPDWDSFTISADLEEATPIPFTIDLDISTGAFTYREDGAFSAQGTVTNTSGQPLKVILLRVIARNANGGYVRSGSIGVIGDFFDGQYQSLEPGGSYKFTISAFVDPFLSDALNFGVTGFGILAE